MERSIIGVIKGDTRSLDYSLHGAISSLRRLEDVEGQLWPAKSYRHAGSCPILERRPVPTTHLSCKCHSS